MKQKCENGCGRRADKRSVGGYCCKQCIQWGSHTDKCDNREANRE